MYQINLKGFIEVEDSNKLLDRIEKAIKDSNAELIGQFVIYKLAPYVDYQKADVTDA